MLSLGKKVAFYYHVTKRSGRVETLTAELVTLEQENAKKRFQSYRFDAMESDLQVWQAPNVSITIPRDIAGTYAIN